MNVGVTLRPSRTKSENDPGHMAVFWRHSEELHFRGYYFELEDLPKEHRDPSKYRNYLFENTVPGYICCDDNAEDDYRDRRGMLVCKSWSAADSLDDFLEEITKPRQYGLYSFNPDKFDCHNCVTWVVETVNSAIGNVLPRVRQGRIKLMKAQLEALP